LSLLRSGRRTQDFTIKRKEYSRGCLSVTAAVVRSVRGPAGQMIAAVPILSLNQCEAHVAHGNLRRHRYSNCRPRLDHEIQGMDVACWPAISCRHPSRTHTIEHRLGASNDRALPTWTLRSVVPKGNQVRAALWLVRRPVRRAIASSLCAVGALLSSIRHS
jgi:hypothetical protein